MSTNLTFESISAKKSAIIVDLDGTLVDVDAIRWLVEGKTKDFNRFHLESKNSPEFDEVARLCNFAFFLGLEIHVVSGRLMKFHELSTNWLEANEIKFSSLQLRKENDFRPDVVIKKEMFENLNMRNIIIAIDDKPAMRELWKQCGIKKVLDPRNFPRFQELAEFIHTFI